MCPLYMPLNVMFMLDLLPQQTSSSGKWPSVLTHICVRDQCLQRPLERLESSGGDIYIWIAQWFASLTLARETGGSNPGQGEYVISWWSFCEYLCNECR